MAIDVVVGDVAVQPAADEIRQSADGPDVGRFIEREAVVNGKASSGIHLLHDRNKRRVAHGRPVRFMKRRCAMDLRL